MKVWTCKIVLEEDQELPIGADNAPREAAIAACEEILGLQVEACFSGWGGKLDSAELALLLGDRNVRNAFSNISGASSKIT